MVNHDTDYILPCKIINDEIQIFIENKAEQSFIVSSCFVSFCIKLPLEIVLLLVII